MNTISRLALTVVAAMLVGACSYASASDLDRNGELGAVVFSPVVGLAALALLVLVPCVVNRWWAASIALVPLAVAAFLHEATDYVYPFHEDPYPVLTLMGSFFLLCLACLGFALRRVAYVLAARLG